MKKDGKTIIEACDYPGGGKLTWELPPDVLEELSSLPKNKREEYLKDLEQSLAETARTMGTIALNRGIYYGVRLKFHEELKEVRKSCAETEPLEKSHFILA
ncbi:MAG: hypothetical protein WC878_01920 [Candidatus Paceibacterota bacterium]